MVNSEYFSIVSYVCMNFSKWPLQIDYYVYHIYLAPWKAIPLLDFHKLSLKNGRITQHTTHAIYKYEVRHIPSYILTYLCQQSAVPEFISWIESWIDWVNPIRYLKKNRNSRSKVYWLHSIRFLKLRIRKELNWS